MPAPPTLPTPKLHRQPKITGTQTALGLKVSALLAATLILFYQDLYQLFSDASRNETASYILIIPFIITYLLYRKRKVLRSVMPLNSDHQPKNLRHLGSLAGFLITATAVLLYWHGSYTSSPVEIHMLTFPLFIAGLTLLFFNPQTLKELAFPIIFLFLLLPPLSIFNSANSILQTNSAQASNLIANALKIPSTLTTDNSGNPILTLTRSNGTSIPLNIIDATSSAIYSLIGFMIFAVTVAYIIRDKPWKKAALIIIAIPLVYLLNIARITMMLITSYNFGNDLTLQTLNLFGSFILIFVGALVLLLISEKAFKTHIFSKTSTNCLSCNSQAQAGKEHCTQCGRIFHPAIAKLHKTDLAKAAAVIISAILLVAIQTPVFAISQGTPTILTSTPSGQQYSTNILPQTDQYTLTFIRDVSGKQALSLVYLYDPTDKSTEQIWLSLVIASAQSGLISWKTSSTRIQIESRDVQLTQNPATVAHYFAFNYTLTQETQVVLYWTTSSFFMINQTAQKKYVEISLIAYPSSMDELPIIEQQQLELANQISAYWQPAQTWSEATLVLFQNGLTLSTVTSAALVATLLYYAVETRKQKKTNLQAASKLPNLSQEILKAVRKTKKPATLEALAETLKKTTKQNISPEQLEQRLTELENAGIIRSQIYNQQDNPIQTWKT